MCSVTPDRSSDCEQGSVVLHIVKEAECQKRIHDQPSRLQVEVSTLTALAADGWGMGIKMPQHLCITSLCPVPSYSHLSAKMSGTMPSSYERDFFRHLHAPVHVPDHPQTPTSNFGDLAKAAENRACQAK